jgi:nucleotide-binding universal stress UspA family protein
MNEEQRQEPITHLLRDPKWLRERVITDGSAIALERGREWAEALGAELAVLSRPARLEARLVVVDAADGHVRSRVKHAVSPLLIARPRTGSGRFLVALDFDDPLEHALKWLARLERARPAEVTLAHSIDPGIHEAEWMANFGGSNVGFVPDDARARGSAAEARLTQLLTRSGLQGSVRISDRPAVPFILELAEELRADLVAVGMPRRRGLLHRTIAGEIAAAAFSAVLVLPGGLAQP